MSYQGKTTRNIPPQVGESLNNFVSAQKRRKHRLPESPKLAESPMMKVVLMRKREPEEPFSVIEKRVNHVEPGESLNTVRTITLSPLPIASELKYFR